MQDAFSFGSGAKRGLKSTDQGRMQDSQFGYPSMRRGWRNAEPFGCIGQIDSSYQIKLRVVAETGRVSSVGINVAQDRDLPPMQHGGALVRAIDCPHLELWCVIVKGHKCQYWSGYCLSMTRMMAP